MNVVDIVKLLRLEPHPEGGHFRETFRDGPNAAGRAHGTAIYYLLCAGEVSRWHRVDAAEIWHWYGGGPLELRIAHEDGRRERIVLGNDLTNGEVPQGVVPAHAWQTARPLGAYALLGCTVSPGFEFSGFDMAEEGWEP